MDEWRLQAAAAPREAPDPVRAEYAREGRPLFWLALGQACLTILTLGIYRFWMTTRLRRYYWSAIRLCGDPFEYTGTGVEKLIGFLVAITILAVYLALVNVAFVFGGLISTDDVLGLELAINLSLLASLPLIYFATYRAKRYIMARTRWRGIRFGVEQGAWGFAGRAVLLSLLSALTIGLLYPLQNFRLTKFVTDRTWFGDLKFEQGGRWTGLLGAWLWIYPGVAIVIGAVVLVALYPEDEQMAAIAGLLLLAGYFAVYLAMLRYRVFAFRYFWRHRLLASARFRNGVDTGEVIGVTIAGSMAVWMVALFAAIIAIVIAIVALMLLIGEDRFNEILMQIDARQTDGKAAWQMLAIVAVGYLAAVPFAMACHHVFLIRPILRRQVEGMRIDDPRVLQSARQRSHDHALEAGGFADALGVDIGSGF